jgi:hypothetical protein
MREHVVLRADLVEAVERRAAARGEPFEVAAARALARGAVRVLTAGLSPLLDEDQEVKRSATERAALSEGDT